MTEVVLGPRTPANDAIGTGAVVEGSAPVLITEQQVMFATAAALPERHSGPASWLRGLTRLFAGARTEKASARRSAQADATPHGGTPTSRMRRWRGRWTVCEFGLGGADWRRSQPASGTTTSE